jgi:putative inorganic carbon (HCO3(-)) transporter
MSGITTPESSETAASKAAAFVSGEWIALALLSPLFVLPPVGRPLLTLVLLLPVVWIVRSLSGQPLLPATPLNGSLLVLVFAVIASLAATFDVLFSAPKVLGVIFGIAVFFAVVKSARDRRTLHLFLRLFSAAGGLLAIAGILGTQWIHKIVLLRTITAHLPAVIRGVPGQTEGFQPNAIAGALVLFVPLQLALARSEPARRQRLFHLAVLAITASTLLLTQSRSGYLSLAAGCFAWALWHGRRSRLVALVLLAAALVAIVPLRERVASPLASDVDSRFELWSRAMTMISDFPITGVGMNGFRRVMPVMYPTLLTPSDVDVAHAHNHLLQAALDLGLPGLVAYLALWLGAAALLVRAYRMTHERSQRWIIGGMAAGMIAYFAFGTADAIALGAKVGIFFWIALALIVSMHSDAEQPA